MKQIDLREGARRQHRSAAVFAVIQCWLRGLDGVIFKRHHLERILGLKRFKRTRVEWLQEDLKDFFPHQEVYWAAGKTNADGDLYSFQCLWASRRELKQYLARGTMSILARLKTIPADGPRLAVFNMWPHPSSVDIQSIFDETIPFFTDPVNYDERLLTSYLSLLCQGQISPQSMSSLFEEV
jgi:hypothetical protein